MFHRAVKELIGSQKLVTLNPDDTVDRALDVLATNNITSAPVSSKGNPKEVLGFVDMLDLLAYLIRVSTTKLLAKKGVGESYGIQWDDLSMLRDRSSKFYLTPVKGLIDYSKRNPYYWIQDTKPIRDAVHLFATTGVHRVAVVDAGDNLLGVLTQSQLVRELEKSLHDNDFCRRRSAADVQMVSLRQFPYDMEAIDAFITMHDYGVSSLSLVDDNGSIVDVISASDLKGIGKDFARLLHPAYTFVKESRQVQSRTTGPVTCHPTTSLFDVMHKMNAERVHRIFVATKENKPTGVISLTDLVKELDKIAAVAQE
jgi:CBS domain-containing protein